MPKSVNNYGQQSVRAEKTKLKRQKQEQYRIRKRPENEDRPPDSPIAQSYDIGNSSSKMLLANKTHRAHLRGYERRQPMTTDPERHFDDNTKANERHHTNCLDSSSPRYERKPRMKNMWINQDLRPPWTPVDNNFTNPQRHRSCQVSSDPALYSLYNRREQHCKISGTEKKYRRPPISMKDNHALFHPELSPSKQRYIFFIAKAYDQTNLKQLKQLQYRDLLLRQQYLGFNTDEEYIKYMRYIEGPRKRTYGDKTPLFKSGKRSNSPTNSQLSSHKTTTASNTSFNNEHETDKSSNVGQSETNSRHSQSITHSDASSCGRRTRPKTAPATRHSSKTSSNSRGHNDQNSSTMRRSLTPRAQRTKQSATREKLNKMAHEKKTQQREKEQKHYANETDASGIKQQKENHTDGEVNTAGKSESKKELKEDTANKDDNKANKIVVKELDIKEQKYDASKIDDASIKAKETHTDDRDDIASKSKSEKQKEEDKADTKDIDDNKNDKTAIRNNSVVAKENSDENAVQKIQEHEIHKEKQQAKTTAENIEIKSQKEADATNVKVVSAEKLPNKEITMKATDEDNGNVTSRGKKTAKVTIEKKSVNSCEIKQDTYDASSTMSSNNETETNLQKSTESKEEVVETRVGAEPLEREQNETVVEKQDNKTEQDEFEVTNLTVNQNKDSTQKREIIKFDSDIPKIVIDPDTGSLSDNSNLDAEIVASNGKHEDTWSLNNGEIEINPRSRNQSVHEKPSSDEEESKSSDSSSSDESSRELNKSQHKEGIDRPKTRLGNRQLHSDSAELLEMDKQKKADNTDEDDSMPSASFYREGIDRPKSRVGRQVKNIPETDSSSSDSDDVIGQEMKNESQNSSFKDEEMNISKDETLENKGEQTLPIILQTQPSPRDTDAESSENEGRVEEKLTQVQSDISEHQKEKSETVTFQSTPETHPGKSQDLLMNNPGTSKEMESESTTDTSQTPPQTSTSDKRRQSDNIADQTDQQSKEIISMLQQSGFIEQKTKTPSEESKANTNDKKEETHEAANENKSRPEPQNREESDNEQSAGGRDSQDQTLTPGAEPGKISEEEQQQEIEETNRKKAEEEKRLRQVAEEEERLRQAEENKQKQDNILEQLRATGFF